MIFVNVKLVKSIPLCVLVMQSAVVLAWYFCMADHASD